MKNKKAIFLFVITLLVVIGMFLMVACPPNTEEGTTTTKKPATTTTTTTIEVTDDPSLTFTPAELQKGYQLNGDDLIFGIPKTIYDTALAQDSSVKYIKHHGEYWGVWNWGEVRVDVTWDGGIHSAYITRIGANVAAQVTISKTRFIDDNIGAIFSSWGDPTKYQWGFQICGANGNQLPNADDGGTVPNWIAKNSTDTTQWAIKDKDFGESQDTADAAEDVTNFGATTTMPVFKDFEWGIGAAFTNVAWAPESNKFTKLTTNLYYLEFDLTNDVSADKFGVANNAWTHKFTGASVQDNSTDVQLTYGADANADLTTSQGGGTYTMTLTTDDESADVNAAVVRVRVDKK